MGLLQNGKGSGFSQSGTVTFPVRQRSPASNIFNEAMRPDHLVIYQIYGKNVIDKQRQGDLMNGIPKADPEFVRGYENAAKIYFLLYGKHKLHDDLDYKAALAAVQGGAKMDKNGTDDANVASFLMLRIPAKLTGHSAGT